MIALKTIREETQRVRAALAARGATAPIDDILRLDEERRQRLGEVESLRATRNEVSKKIGALRGGPGTEELKAQMRQVGKEIDYLDGLVREVEARLESLLLEVPNLPHPTVPQGRDDTENVVVRQVGEPTGLGFAPLPHWELGERLGIINFEWGIKLSGSRFYVLRGQGARLQRAVIQWLLDLHLQQGYEEVYTPFMVREACLVGAGQLPKFRDNLYHDAEEDFWFVPTAEVPVTNLHRDEIMDISALPRRYVAYTPCFRREKMAAGRDVRGIKRGHQFDKVEMYKFTTPETSYDELETLTADAEACCRLLGLTYRVKALCTGDLGFAAAKSYDVEVWAPGCGEWLEVSSCSNCEDFQARRANIRFRRAPDARPEFVHTLNGSGLGIPRTLIAILETYQQADGTIRIPEVLRPYLGGAKVIG